MADDVRFKDFDAALAELEGDPLTFKLGGTVFTCVPEIPAGRILWLARHADKIDSDAFAAFAAFVESVVIVEQRPALWDALDTIGLSTLLELIQWLIQEATGRPLTSASSSPEEQPEDGEPSRVVSLSPVTPETRSA